MLFWQLFLYLGALLMADSSLLCCSGQFRTRSDSVLFDYLNGLLRTHPSISLFLWYLTHAPSHLAIKHRTKIQTRKHHFLDESLPEPSTESLTGAMTLFPTSKPVAT